jgi:hypothetical protein
MEEHKSNLEAAIGGATKVIVVMLLPPLVSSSFEKEDISLCARDLRLYGRHQPYLEASRPSRW